MIPTLTRKRYCEAPCGCNTAQRATENEDGQPVWKCMNCFTERPRTRTVKADPEVDALFERLTEI